MLSIKKFITVLFSIVIIFLSSCDVTNNMSGKETPIPRYVDHIEFWNGGTCIVKYDSAEIRINSVFSSVLVGEDITWYYYEVKYIDEEGHPKVETIIDSESLAIKYDGSRKD